MSENYQEARAATVAAIAAAREMLRYTEDVHPRWTAASAHVLKRLYPVGANDDGKVQVPFMHRRRDAIPVAMVSPGEVVHVSAATLAPTRYQRQSTTRLVEQYTCDSSRIEQAHARNHIGKGLQAQDHSIVDGSAATVHASFGYRGVSRAGSFILAQRDRPIVLIDNALVDVYAQEGASPAFRAEAGVVMMHETRHLVDNEDPYAAMVFPHTDMALALSQGEYRKGEQCFEGESNAYGFQHDKVAALLANTACRGLYDVESLEKRLEDGRTGRSRMLDALAELTAGEQPERN